VNELNSGLREEYYIIFTKLKTMWEP